MNYVAGLCHMSLYSLESKKCSVPKWLSCIIYQHFLLLGKLLETVLPTDWSTCMFIEQVYIKSSYTRWSLDSEDPNSSLERIHQLLYSFTLLCIMITLPSTITLDFVQNNCKLKKIHCIWK